MPIYLEEIPDGGFAPILDDDGHLMVFDEFAPCPGCGCDETLYDTGCPDVDCYGYVCTDCGWGCMPDGLHARKQQERIARIRRRAGLDD